MDTQTLKEHTLKIKQAGDAYKNCQYKEASEHLLHALHLDNSDIKCLYYLAKTMFHQRKFKDCIKFAKRVTKIGKQQKGDVIVIARSYVWKGRARMEIGKYEEGRRTIARAVIFLTKIARVKLHKKIWDSATKFCNKAIALATEYTIEDGVIGDTLRIKYRAWQRGPGVMTRQLRLRRGSVQNAPDLIALWDNMLTISKDYYHLKKGSDLQYKACYASLKTCLIDGAYMEPQRRQELVALQNKALRRLTEIPSEFDNKHWIKYTADTSHTFINKEAFKKVVLNSSYSPEMTNFIFRLMDLEGISLVNRRNAKEMKKIILQQGYLDRIKHKTLEICDKCERKGGKCPATGIH